MLDPATSFAVGLIIGTLLSGLWAVFVYRSNEKDWRVLVNDLVRQRTHLVGQRQSLQRDLRGLAKASERLFSVFLKSLTHIDGETLRTVRRVRMTLNRAKKA